MCARRRSASADEDGARIAVGTIKGVGPTGGEASGPDAIERIVEVLSAIPSGLHDDNAPARGIENGLKVVFPPLDRDISELVIPRLEVVPRAGTMQLDQNDVSSAQAVGGILDGFGRIS